MAVNEAGAHPWMGNSLASMKQSMLDEIGVATIEELFEQIPKEHRLKKPLKLPPGIKSEASLEAASHLDSCQERGLRGQSEFPRRRLLAASCAGRRR